MNEKEYVKVDTLKYVKEGLESGVLVPIEAEKYARIIARVGVVDEEVITMSVDENGNAIEEKRDTVEIDPKTGKPGWVVTKADENGNPIVDKNGNTNQWIIEDSIFSSKYEVACELGEGVYKPVGGVQIFVQFPDNLILHQWGSAMKVAAGGYINITNVDDLYGISKRDFEDTYKVKTTSLKQKKINQ